MKDRDVQEFRGLPVKTRTFTLAGRSFEMLVPANCEALIDTPAVIERFEQDEYMPYWAELWPACLLLGEAVSRWPAPGGNPPRVLEIGCGLGLVSLLLCEQGYRVVASDYDEDALAFVVENARRNRIPVPETRRVDWREHYHDLKVERIVAADVLYELRNTRPVVEFIRAHLTPDGLAVVADPNRATPEEFASVARHCGLMVEETPMEVPAPPGGQPTRGRLFCLRHGGSHEP